MGGTGRIGRLFLVAALLASGLAIAGGVPSVSAQTADEREAIIAEMCDILDWPLYAPQGCSKPDVGAAGEKQVLAIGGEYFGVEPFGDPVDVGDEGWIEFTEENSFYFAHWDLGFNRCGYKGVLSDFRTEAGAIQAATALDDLIVGFCEDATPPPPEGDPCDDRETFATAYHGSEAESRLEQAQVDCPGELPYGDADPYAFRYFRSSTGKLVGLKPNGSRLLVDGRSCSTYDPGDGDAFRSAFTAVTAVALDGVFLVTVPATPGCDTESSTAYIAVTPRGFTLCDGVPGTSTRGSCSYFSPWSGPDLARAWQVDCDDQPSCDDVLRIFPEAEDVGEVDYSGLVVAGPGSGRGYTYSWPLNDTKFLFEGGIWEYTLVKSGSTVAIVDPEGTAWEFRVAATLTGLGTTYARNFAFLTYLIENAALPPAPVARAGEQTRALPVSTLFLTTGEKYPDGLAVAAVAGVERGLTLLVDPDDATSNIGAIDALEPERVVIVGGSAAVPDDSLPDFGARGIAESRVEGATRYETAVELSAANFSPGVDTVFVATGLNFPDAIGAGSVAAAEGWPVLLTRTDEIPSVVADELSRLSPRRIVILGGEAAVSSGVESSLAAFASEVTRVGGATRFETAVELSQLAFDRADVVYVVNGTDFGSALSVASAGWVTEGPLLLTSSSEVPGVVLDEIARLGAADVHFVGDVSTLSLGVLGALDDAVAANHG